MRDTIITQAVAVVVELKLEAIDKLIEEVIEPLGDIGNPEKLIGRKYEDWTPQDIQRLAMVYGIKEPNPLSDLIFRKEYKKVKQEELEV